MTIDQGNHGQAAESESSAPLHRDSRVLVDPDGSRTTDWRIEHRNVLCAGLHEGWTLRCDNEASQNLLKCKSRVI